MENLFALIDCNNFYVSCERVFNPQYQGKAVVVLSNNDGCIIARSNEAKALGIAMGTPFFKCKDIINRYRVEVLSSNYALYGDMSRRVMNTLQQFTPSLEVYSIDEAFLSLTGAHDTSFSDYARTIKMTVRQWTGIPVSVGIGPTKVLAKIANKLAKRDETYGGIFDLTACKDIDVLLESLTVHELLGIGRQCHGITNVTLSQGDGANGWSAGAPFDAILLTGSLPELPESFLKTLTIGGRLVAVVGNAPIMEAILVTRLGEHQWSEESLFETATPPLRNVAIHQTFIL